MNQNKKIFSLYNAARAAVLIALLTVPVFIVKGGPEVENGPLESVLNQMEKSSGNFKGFAADIIKKKYNAILEEFDPPQSGKFFYKRSKKGAALIREEITDPGIKITTIDDKRAVIYKPKIKEVTEYSLGKNKDKVEYLVMGIGQSPADLKEKFEISFLNTETLGDTVCSVLKLKPRDPEVSKEVPFIILWVNNATGVSTQVKLEFPYEDYMLVNFSNEKMDSEIEDSVFKQKLPGDVEVMKLN